MITMLGIDPGTNNCAFGVVQMKLNPVRFRIVERGMIKNTVKEMNGFNVGADMKKFASEIRSIKRRHNVDFAIAERYMTRGHGGTTIEAISSMLGILGTVFGTEVCFIPAATWKNAWNKRYCLKTFYEEMAVYGIPTHVIDAVSIGLYGATLVLEGEHFTVLDDIKVFKKRLIQTK